MNRIISAIKKIRLNQILMTFLAGVLLFVSTACNSPGNSVQAKNPRPEVPGGTATSPNRDVINSYKGPMNDFSDVDPRAEKQQSELAKKAEALKQNAERNVIDQTGSVGENTKRILDKKGENAADFGKNVRRNVEDATDKAQGTAEDVAKGTKRGTENIKDNTSNVTRDASKTASRAGEDVKDAGKNLGYKAQRAADNTSGYVQDKTNEASQNTSNFIQDKLNQAAQSTQRTLNKAANAVGDTID